jgi:phytoene synthase
MDSVVLNSREMIRAGSRSFAAAAKLFSPQTRHGAYMLYAWCRHCDDRIDGQDLGFGMTELGADEQQGRLAELRLRTDRALAGQLQDDPVFDGLCRIIQQHRIPARFPLELLEGFRMDVERQAYTTLDDTLLYCYRVAGVVGVMMACVMGAREAAVLQRAADLGIAFQLTNIARDVLDDAGAGRCYLPADWLASAGLTPADQAAPEHRERLSGLVAQLLDEADRYYASAREGLRALPFRSAWAVATALGVYRDIGRVIRARGPRAWDQRAVVSHARKLWHAGCGAAVAARTTLFGKVGHQLPRDQALWLAAELRGEDSRITS